MSRSPRSLFGEILDWMLAPLLLVWPLSVALTWLIAQNIADKPFDRELGEQTRVLARLVQVPQLPSQPIHFELPGSASEILHVDAQDELWFQVRGPNAEILGGDALVPMPTATEDWLGPSGEVRWRDTHRRGLAIRVAWLWLDVPGQSNRVLVQVGETMSKRSRLAAEIIKGVMLPQFVMLPLAVLLVWLALVRGIAPLSQLQQRIRARASDDLSPIDERGAPEEVAPLVDAINDLLRRLDLSVKAQKHFLADAAHQLKTPLAGLRTQAELAQRELDRGQEGEQSVRRSLVQIARSSQRAAHMANQLLSMARAEDQTFHRQMTDVSLADIAHETVQDFVPRALDKRIDLGFEGPESEAEKACVRVHGHPVLLRELLGNLVDNALLYTPEGGMVTVRVQHDPSGPWAMLQVEDSGPGIAPSERDLVFAPFYRALGTQVDGSGLGLAIVKEIAQAHEAEIELTDANERHRYGLNDQAGGAFGPGTLFSIRFQI